CAMAGMPGSACGAGQCMVDCQANLTDCGGQCTNLQNDVLNCGACGKVGPIGQACFGGACVPTCQMPLVDCGGACVDPRFDPNHCGGCNKKCALANAMPACAGGKCAIASCNPGFGDCAQIALAGCEANLATDPLNS